ncbi:hypothetical protein NVP1122B_11 [Vibrio phage 1.122.B._10N.286.46.F8]|nr:hypothetical protein NVP1122A_11 [Vibrio phage 1.122.A._10N.286.46.F8]AUR89371.1 hypothetical protein NVP1122B_11 [Vibrio phage 1.122.B._10N.286.46.F8]
MKISQARKLTGFEKCDPDAYDDKCSCGKEQNRYNPENYLRTCYEYDEGVYACSKCVIEIAKAQEQGHLVVL